MKKQQIFEWAAFLSRIGLGVIWIMAGASKIGKIGSTTQSIEAYQIFTFEWSRFLAHIIGPVEIIGGVLLLLGCAISFCSIVSISVLTLFIVGLTQAILRGFSIDCGCFGSGDLAGSQLDMVIAILRDFTLIGLTVLVWKNSGSRKLSIDGYLASKNFV